MKLRILLSAAILSCALISCKKELEPQESSTPVEAAPTAATAPDAPNVPVVNAPQPGQSATVTQAPTPAPAPQSPQPVAKGMNPAHGQPGHRCDIPVGAPLNSPAKAPATPAVQPGKAMTVNQTPAQTQPATPAILNPSAQPAATTAPGMNPPHGQEGHRCDVAVGAPLPK